MLRLKSCMLGFSALLGLSRAIQLDVTNPASVKAATSQIAYDMMTYYSGNTTGQTPGILPGPCSSDTCYYWWEAGAMWGALINYQQYTGDTSYNPTVIQALQFQVGPDQNYNPPNQSKNMGIDDQDFWGFAAMEAAEAGIPDPSSGPSWLSLAQAVWNFQTPLWDNATCGGGFRWQVYSFNAGYNLKNTVSNGGVFQLSARLASYTGNQTYADWAEKIWTWLETTPLFQTQNGVLYIWDNTDTNTGCTSVENYVWSYNYGMLLYGAAHMWNYTNGAAIWQTRINNILNGAESIFFPSSYGGNIMSEVLCEDQANCNNDQKSFKAYLARWMAVTTLLAPFTEGQIMPKLRASAVGAAQQCSGGPNGRMCGTKWYSSTWDGSSGVGQQMSALAVIGATQITSAMTPLTAKTGGTSKSNPNAGESTTTDSSTSLAKITNADRFGAAILTVLVVISLVGLCIWIVL